MLLAIFLSALSLECPHCDANSENFFPARQPLRGVPAFFYNSSSKVEFVWRFTASNPPLSAQLRNAHMGSATGNETRSHRRCGNNRKVAARK